MGLRVLFQRSLLLLSLFLIMFALGAQAGPGGWVFTGSLSTNLAQSNKHSPTLPHSNASKQGKGFGRGGVQLERDISLERRAVLCGTRRTREGLLIPTGAKTPYSSEENHHWSGLFASKLLRAFDGRELHLQFDVEQFASGMLSMQTRTPGGQEVQTQFDLDSLK
jgi:hypothetical protein